MAQRLLTSFLFKHSTYTNKLTLFRRNLTVSNPKSSPAPPSRNPITRAITFLRNDPFSRVSIIFGGTVLIMLLVVESFVPKPQKRVQPQIVVYPPRSTHPVINRSETEILASWIPSFYSLTPLVAMVTGPSGCGKTELTNQFAHRFIEHCTPRLVTKPSKQPIMLYVDAHDLNSLERSARFCAHVLGLKHSDIDGSLVKTLDSVLSKLSSQKAKWLLILDGLSASTSPIVNESLESISSNGRKYRKGTILMTSTDDAINTKSIGMRNISLSNRLSMDDAMRLFVKVSTIDHSDLPSLDPLLDSIGTSPLSISLAGLTVRVYNYFYNSPSQSVTQYTEALENKTHLFNDQTRPLHGALELYTEAVGACDSNFMHAIDFIGSCNKLHPLPVSVIRQHLKHQFYKNVTQPSEIFSSVSNDGSISTVSNSSSIPSYFTMVKNKIPIFGGSSAQQENLQNQLQQAVTQFTDVLRSTMMSPFIRVSELTGYDIQLLHLHPLAAGVVDNNFRNNSITSIEENELKRAKAQWDRTAWFRRFRSFDPKQALSTFLSSLPGLKDGRVLTEQQYYNDSPHESYSQYLHVLSHNHRVTTSIVNELRYLQTRDTENQLIRKYLQPHLEHLQQQDGRAITSSDALHIETSLLNITSSYLTTDSPSPIISDANERYNHILDTHVRLYGANHPDTARVLTSIAELHYQTEAHYKAIELLTRAIEIYSDIDSRSKTPDQCADHASSLSLLGLAYSAIGKRKECVSNLEKSMMLYQSIPSEQSDVTKSQRKIVATTVTDLGHGYIMLGDFNAAKKYLDLAAMAQRGIHGDYHHEVLRVLNIQSIVYALMGGTDECKITRREAGEIQKELSLMSDII